MTRRLLASIHDVTPAHEARLDRLVPLVESAVGRGRFAMLVVPDFHGGAPLIGGTAFARRIRSWSDSGCEIFLHGFTHRDDSSHSGRLAQMKAKKLTAGEGEFLGLDADEAARRLRSGRSLIEDIIGRPVAGFIAPAWLYGPRIPDLLAALEFPLAEDHFKVWSPIDGAVLTRGPVITYASRSPARLASSLLWSRIASLLLRGARVVRHAVHPHDVDAPELIAEISRSLAGFARSHRPSAYADLVRAD